MTLAFYLSDMQAKAWGCIEGLKKILRSLTTIAMDDARKWEGGGKRPDHPLYPTLAVLNGDLTRMCFQYKRKKNPLVMYFNVYTSPFPCFKALRVLKES